jgi:DoxX-like family
MSAAIVVVTALTALLFFAAAAMKLTGQRRSLATRDRLGIDQARWRLIGLLEIAGATGALVGLALRPLGIAATAGLVLTSIGALGAHLRMGNLRSEGAPGAAALVLSSAALVLQSTTA